MRIIVLTKLYFIGLLVFLKNILCNATYKIVHKIFLLKLSTYYINNSISFV